MYLSGMLCFFFFFSSRRRHTRWPRDWSSDVCSSDLITRIIIVPIVRVIRVIAVIIGINGITRVAQIKTVPSGITCSPIKAVLLSVRAVCTCRPVGVAAEGSLRTTGVRIPLNVGNRWQLRTVTNLEGLLVTVTHNTLELVELTTGVLLGFGKVSVKQQVEIIADIPVNIQAERLVFGDGFVPVLNVIESTVFAHLNNGTVFIDDHIINTTSVKPHTEL